MMPSIEETIAYATMAHMGQKDKVGKPYIFHPLRLMLRQSDLGSQTVALLHDTVEDKKLTLDDLRKRGYPEDIVKDVEILTRREKETYTEYLQRVRDSKSERALNVKLSDIEDHLDRVDDLVGEAKDYALKKYREGHKFVKESINEVLEALKL